MNSVRWSLKPLPASRITWTLRRIFETPVAPIVISALLAGLNTNIRQILVGLCICILWTAVSLWPIALALSDEFINEKMRFTNKRRLKLASSLDISQARLEQHRKLLRRGLVAVLYAILCIPTTLAFSLGAAYINQRQITSARSAAYDNFVISTIVSASDPRGGGLFVFTNKGTEQIFFRQLDCHVISMKTNNNGYSHLVFRVMKKGILLHEGGDSQVLPCPGQAMLLKGSVIICADIDVEAKFSLNHDSEGSMVKPFRYIKVPGRDDWLPIAANTVMLPCPE